MKKYNFIFVLLLSLSFFSCNSKEKTVTSNDAKVVTINEVFQTPRDESDNVDSPAFWSSNDTSWIISTAKDSDLLIINNATTGEELFRFGKTGTNPGEFKRPNGISVCKNYLFVVERDNHRVQVLTLPNFTHVGFFAESDLKKPYGIFTEKLENFYNIYITDNYEYENDEQLNNRIAVYSLKLSNGFTSKLLFKFGESSGNGRLPVVESIFGDRMNDNLLIARENEEEGKKGVPSVKVYSMDGKFKKSIGNNIFKAEVEGIALYKTDSLNGYWFVTDQSMDKNIFHIFDRLTLKHIGAFSGKNTLNTDGIWITQVKYENFPKGAFFAIHNDGNVSAFNLSEIADSLKLKL